VYQGICGESQKTKFSFVECRRSTVQYIRRRGQHNLQRRHILACVSESLKIIGILFNFELRRHGQLKVCLIRTFQMEKTEWNGLDNFKIHYPSKWNRQHCFMGLSDDLNVTLIIYQFTFTRLEREELDQILRNSNFFLLLVSETMLSIRDFPMESFLFDHSEDDPASLMDECAVMST
jgi:hypothetical protein